MAKRHEEAVVSRTLLKDCISGIVKLFRGNRFFFFFFFTEATATQSKWNHAKWCIFQRLRKHTKSVCECALRQPLMKLSNSSLINTLPQSRMNETQQKHPEGPRSSRLSSLLHVFCCLSVSASNEEMGNSWSLTSCPPENKQTKKFNKVN